MNKFWNILRTAMCGRCGRTWADGSSKLTTSMCAPGVGCQAK